MAKEPVRLWPELLQDLTNTGAEEGLNCFPRSPNCQNQAASTIEAEQICDIIEVLADIMFSVVTS